MAIDVGTGSVRVALFTSAGKKVSYSSAAIKIRNPHVDNYEQSTDNIWQSIVQCVRSVVDEIGLKSGSDWYIASIGVDATCSLVVCLDDECLTPVSLTNSNNPDVENNPNNDVFNVMLWMDRRSVDDTEFINEIAQHNQDVKSVLSHFGGVMSPENQPPKIRWLCRTQRQRFHTNNIVYFDLSDWLVTKLTACGRVPTHARSTCTLACKWGWHDREWNSQFWSAIGLEHICDNDFRAIGKAHEARYPGSFVSNISESVRVEFGFNQKQPCAVASPLIDAYAGSVWATGLTSVEPGRKIDQSNVVSFVCGTSTCVLRVGQDPVFVPGVWGPYKHALIPHMHVTEGGQTITGKLLEHVVKTHPACERLREQFGDDNDRIFSELIAECLSQRDSQDAATHVHVLDYHAGNRSPIADPSLRGVVTGLSLDTSVGNLAVLFRATIQSLCYGGRRIIDAMLNAGSVPISIIAGCGGLCKNELFITELADCVQMPVALCEEVDTVLLGCAVLARMAHQRSEDMVAIVGQMCHVGRVVRPRHERRSFHDRKYKVYQKMLTDFLSYRELMESHSVSDR